MWHKYRYFSFFYFLILKINDYICNKLCICQDIIKDSIMEKNVISMESLSDDNKRWLAEKLIESVSADNTKELAKERILNEIAEGLADVEAGRTIPARDLFKHLQND